MIVAAAYRLSNGLIVSLPRPAFHSDIGKAQPSFSGYTKASDAEKGYINDRGEFLLLHQAMRHAIKTGQARQIDAHTWEMVWDADTDDQNGMSDR